MIDFSSLEGFSGEFLRFLLRAFPYKGYLPIFQGEARGMLWKRRVGADGYWLGSYEAFKQHSLAKFLKPGTVFYDVGAYAGFYTLIGCKKGALVCAFEPDSRNLGFLKTHLKVNKCAATVFPVAVSDKDGVERFRTGENPTSHQLALDGERKVECRSIDSLIQEIPPPTVIKIDAEGAERKILQGAKHTLAKYHPIIFIEGEKKEFENLLPKYLFYEIHHNEFMCIPNQ